MTSRAAHRREQLERQGTGDVVVGPRHGSVDGLQVLALQFRDLDLRLAEGNSLPAVGSGPESVIEGHSRMCRDRRVGDDYVPAMWWKEEPR